MVFMIVAMTTVSARSSKLTVRETLVTCLPHTMGMMAADVFISEADGTSWAPERTVVSLVKSGSLSIIS